MVMAVVEYANRYSNDEDYKNGQRLTRPLSF
jgi:hypothetical protein